MQDSLGASTRLILCLLLWAFSAESGFGLNFIGYEPRLHDRFYTDPDRAFIGDGQPWSRDSDWSGVGRRTEPIIYELERVNTAWSLTMISEHYFLAANHAKPNRKGDDPDAVPPVRFYRTDDPAGEFWEGIIKLNAATPTGYEGGQVASYDMWLGRFDQAPPDWVRRYPLVKRNTNTDWIRYIDPTVYLVGHGSDVDTLGTTMHVGRNQIEHRSGGLMTLDASAPPGLGADEAVPANRDSGSPIFAITPAGPALFKISSTLGSGPTIPEAYDTISALLPETENIALATDLLGDLNSDYKVDGQDELILNSHFPTTEGARYSQGDLNRDGVIDLADQEIMTAQLGKDIHDPADFNANLAIDSADFAYIANNWLLTVEPGRDGDATGDGLVDRNDVVRFESSRLSAFAGEPLLRIDGDLNLDGLVSDADLILWAANFPREEPAAPFADGDATGDGRVTAADLELMRDNYGQMFADVNADSVVSIADLDVISENWGETGTGELSAGDVNLDGVVNGIDLEAVGNFLGSTFRRPPPSRTVGIVPGDFDGDFDADGNDFLILQTGLEIEASLAEWRTFLEYAEPAIASIPEPAASHLLPAALLTLRRRRTEWRL